MAPSWSMARFLVAGCAASVLAACAHVEPAPAPRPVVRTEAAKAYVAAFLQARQDRSAFPGMTSFLPDATLADAYAVQGMLVGAAYGGEAAIGGYKGGFASPAALARFGIDRPAAGFLPLSGRVDRPYRVRLGDFRKLVIECEIGFELGLPLDRPVQDVAQLRSAVRAIGPAIELADVAVQGENLALVDMVAANISASHYIFEPSFPPDEAGDVNAIVATLALDGRELGRDSATLAFGDQWSALLEVVNQAIRNGHAIKPGDVVLTGAIVQVPAQAGAYVGDFGQLGRIEFVVE